MSWCVVANVALGLEATISPRTAFVALRRLSLCKVLSPNRNMFCAFCQSCSQVHFHFPTKFLSQNVSEFQDVNSELNNM